MPPPHQRTKILIRRFALTTLIKIGYFSFLAFAVCFFALCGFIALVAPDRIRVAPDFAMGNLVGTVIFGLTLWPAVFGVFFGCAAWVGLKAKSIFSQLEIEVVQDVSPPAK